VLLREMHEAVCAIRECKKKTLSSRGEKNEEIISRNSLTHHKKASNFFNKNKGTSLYLLNMVSRYYAMSENVQREGRTDCKKEKPEFERREK
jgi:hypothetical protein